MVLLLAKLGEPTDWTLCGRDPVQVQVTVPPIAMVSTAAFVLPLWPLTNWMLGPAVTEPTGPPPPPPPPPPTPPPPPGLPRPHHPRRTHPHPHRRRTYRCRHNRRILPTTRASACRLPQCVH